MARIDLAGKQVEINREITIHRFLNLYRNREHYVNSWSIEVILEQRTYIVVDNNKILIDYYDTKEVKHNHAIENKTTAGVSTVLSELEHIVRTRADQRYEYISNLVNIAKELGLSIWIEE